MNRLDAIRSKTRLAGLPQNDRERSQRRFLLAGAAALLTATILSLSFGATGLNFEALPKAIVGALGLAQAPSAREHLVLIDIRLPRTLLAMHVGAALAVSGAMMQGMFRNPLADPGLIGVSAGAALAAVSLIVLGHGILAPVVTLLGTHALPLAAFLGGLLVTASLVLIAGGHRGISTAALLLAGIAVAALASAVMGLLAYLSNDRELRDLTLWTLGSLSGASWSKVIGILPFAVLSVSLVPRLARGLDGLLLGEAEAFHIGIDVEATKRLIILATAAAVGSAVAVSGIIGFVGIVVPHVVRLLTGPSHASLLPLSAMLGATLTLVADMISRTIVAPAELPLGIVMAILGAPIFLHLVLRRSAHV